MKEKFRIVANGYAHELSDMYELDFDGWVSDDPGSVACFGDYFIDFNDIRYLVDNDISFEVFVSWHDYCIELQDAYVKLEAFEKLLSDFLHDNPAKSNDCFIKSLLYNRIKALKK